MIRLLGFTLRALSVWALIHAFSPLLKAQNDDWDTRDEPRNGVCFYMDADYRGEKLCANSGDSQRNVGDRFNDKISSIRIFGRAQVTVYEDENFSGASRTFRQDVSNLGDWNDKITSYKVTSGQYGRGSSDSEPRIGACFYTDADYRGDSFCASTGDDQRNVEERFNDKVSSIRVFGSAEVTVYEDENFGGASRTFRQDVSNLRDWNDKITSYKVTGSQYGGGSSDSEPRIGACFYVDADYRGERFCMSPGESQRIVGGRYNDKISSVRVFGRAEVTVYEDEDFRGASRTLRQDVPNLRDWNDKITSIEIR